MEIDQNSQIVAPVSIQVFTFYSIAIYYDIWVVFRYRLYFRCWQQSSHTLQVYVY